MANHITPQETVRLFCRAWFEKRDLETAVSLLSSDIDFVGTGDNEFACGKAEMSRYIQQDIEEIREPFLCSFAPISEQSISRQVHNLSMQFTLKNRQYAWHLRASFTLAHRSGEPWLIKALHVSEPGASQRGREHYPQTLVVENIARQRQELLSNSVPGGMMGGYIEPGFPFYFINRHMLNHLGYETESDFVADIKGLISNCMHPSDRELVDEAVESQLRTSMEYNIEYRMRKRDGSYIWVHDVGRKITAEDGRPAIVSVCIDISAQKKMRDELLHLYNNIPGAVFRCRFDKGFSVIDANDGLFEFIGYTREEFADMGNQMSAVIHPDDYAVMHDKLNSQLKNGNTIHNENRLLCKDGTVKWISLKAQLFQEEDGLQFFCVFIDITDEKRLEERNAELYEQELAYFVELASEKGSTQGRINVTRNTVESSISSSEFHSHSVKSTYDEEVEDLASSAVDPAYGEKIRSTLFRQKIMNDYAAGKADYHFEFLRRQEDGGSIWCSTSFRFYQKPYTNDIIGFYYTTDITSHKIQELLLKRIAQLDYEQLTEVDIHSGDHRILTFVEPVGSEIPVLHDFQREIQLTAESTMDESSQKEYLEKLDFSYMKIRLEEVSVYTFAVEKRDPQGLARVKRFQVFYIDQTLGRVCIARSDVTDVVQKEQRQKEELAAALVAAEQANAAKSDFLSRMSHEIRTPMNAIIGMSTIAAQSIGDDEQVADCISKIGISSRFLLSLINDILDMSRIESGKMLLKNERIPMEEFLTSLNSICYSQAAAKGVEYECIVDPVLEDYYVGDSMKLQQVLLNILSNAIKFTSEGGKVTFSASQRRRSKNDAVLRFIVNDTGIGMSEEFLQHIFEPFSQESSGTTALYGGTGLGLAISKNIVDLMDGKITVRSIKNVGTEFTVDVKLEVPEDMLLRHQKKHDYNFSHLKTLVVDDDVLVCESAVTTLREMGVTAEWVDSGRKAVERVQQLQAAGRFYDMILIDWKMPDMDGIETARRIRAIVGPDVTIIIITAYDWASIEHEARLAGVNLLMSKPMFKSSLVSAFSRALGEKEELTQNAETVVYDFTGKRILLAEDNILNTEVAVMLLENKGFAVDTVENGLRALELFSKSDTGYYDAILMDIRMPLMDGLTATTSIRHLSNADAPYIPIVAMTANAFDDDIEKSKAAGMDAHLAKPIDPDRLYQTLYSLIYKKED